MRVEHRRFRLAPCMNRSWRGRDRFTPECVGIESEQARLLCGRVTELESEFDGWNLRRRTDQQQIGIADGMQGAGAAESAADLVTANRFSDVMNDDQGGMRGVAQPEECLAQGG